MATFDDGKEEWSYVQHALAYLNVADNFPPRTQKVKLFFSIMFLKI
jgi:hypothetical protein